MALIFSVDFDTLPVEPIPRWLGLRDLIEKRLNAVTDPAEGVSDDHLIEYCTVLMSAAEELDLRHFEAFKVHQIREIYPSIRNEILELATKLSMRSSTANAAYSVALPRYSKLKLFSEIERLRTMMTNSDLPEKEKKKFFIKLDELHLIVIAPRVDFSKLMLVVAFLAAGVQGATGFLADAPDALMTITSVIGEAKEAEEEEQRLLQAENEPLKLQDMRNRENTEDEIPF